MRMRKKKWARPELSTCPYFVENPKSLKGKWRERFSHPEHPMELELGCGKGVSTAIQAKENPDVNLVAIDLISDVLGSARRNIEAAFEGAPVENVLLTSQNIMFISDIFSPEDQFRRIWISFPNPWTARKKHRKRQLTHPRQLMQYRELLPEGGEIYFKTDDDTLFAESLEYFPACGFSIKYLTRDLHASGFQPNYETEHERMFSAEGKPIKFLIAVKEAYPCKTPPSAISSETDNT